MARIWPRTRFSTQPSQDGARHGGRGLPGGGEGAASQESRGQRWTPERGRAVGTGHRVTASRAPRRPPHVTAATVLPSSAPDTVSLSLKCHLSRAGSCCSQGKNTLSVSTFLCHSVPTSVLALTSIFFFFLQISFFIRISSNYTMGSPALEATCYSILYFQHLAEFQEQKQCSANIGLRLFLNVFNVSLFHYYLEWELL